METVEKECGALGGLFQAIVNDMKCSYPVWEDFSAKATKLHSQLRTTVLAAVAFLDAFQKVADMATNTRGATRDIGSALTRMCMRHRSIEAKLRQFTNALMESLICPLQDRIEDWKKTANQLDKDHAKEYKRSRHEIKKKSSDTIKLQKKARKGRGDLQPQVDSAMQDVTDMCLLMEEMEKQAVRRALVEERGRFCTFIGFLQPVVNGEIAMLGEITHLQAIIDDLTVLTTDPHKLPPASEQVIKDLKGSDYSWSYQTPPSSPSSSGSRKSSMCSSVNSANSSASRSSGGGGGGGSQPHSPTSCSSSSYRYRSGLSYQPPPPPPPGGGGGGGGAGCVAAHRLSSVSSHDSGFVSQDANVYSKPPSPMPSDITSQKSSSSASSEASETCQSVSECSSPTTFGPSFATFRPSLSHSGSTRPLSVILPVPASPPYNCSPGSCSSSPTSKVPIWKDWSKAGQYEQPVAVAAVHRRKEPLDRLREQESSPGNQGYGSGSHLDPDGQRTRMHQANMAAKHGDDVSPAASDLAMVLTRGLSMDQQKSSRDSLQYSSGYSTQTNTPSCSEDTIPSQDYDCYSVNGDTEAQEAQSDFDKSSTIPRHSNIAQNYRRMIQTKRPASTAGLPSGVMGAGGGGSGTPGTATIRRTPSTKPGVRRTLSSAGPIPIRPPIVPVKTPTVPGEPHPPGYAAGGGGGGGVPVRVGSEECVFFAGAEESHGTLDYVKASPKRLSLPNTAWGSGAGLEVYMHQQQQRAGGGGGGVTEEEQMIAANRHSLVEKIGELVASAQALGEGQFPYPSLPDDTGPPGDGGQGGAEGPGGAEGEGEGAGGDMLTTIRRGVRLRKTVSNDRSAPRIL
ncbi:protein MTSS 2 isoform X2 [Gadus morhua]|uniref:MTSS I-BAR domain containing 2b n=1 Tax=Gadus morhua TaxID=8049 RepID=A0A8C5B701_GADMO|nr:protein MTSS 2-like isoform X2 [Gadus morhua]